MTSSVTDGFRIEDGHRTTCLSVVSLVTSVPGADVDNRELIAIEMLCHIFGELIANQVSPITRADSLVHVTGLSCRASRSASVADGRRGSR